MRTEGEGIWMPCAVRMPLVFLLLLPSHSAQFLRGRYFRVFLQWLETAESDVCIEKNYQNIKAERAELIFCQVTTHSRDEAFKQEKT